MKALVFEEIGKLVYREVSDPEGDFIVRVEGCGICGTDLKTYQKGHHFFTPPAILGHEFYGSIVKVPTTSNYGVGDRVVIAPYYECGECEYCKRGLFAQCTHKHFVSGAFCEYVAIPDNYNKGIYKIPGPETDSLKRDAAVYTLVEPLACVLHGVERLHVRPYSKVLVVGGGPMGILFALYFQQQAVPVVVIEPNAERRTQIIAWGIECKKPGECDASQFDNIIVAVNKAELLAEYVRTIASGGTVLAFSGVKKSEAFIIDSHAIHYREVTLTGCSGFGLPDFIKALELISKHVSHFSKLITHVLPLSEGERAFSLLEQGKAFKIVLTP